MVSGFIKPLHFDITVTEAESAVEAGCVLDDFGWESVAFIHF
tara:strand:+ start:1316 stop:1441 length:126 start_codon:yes stop_codon:yes gene_type:complete